MHKKRIFKYFRNTVSIALAVSLMLGEAGASIGTVYASEPTEVQQVGEIIAENEAVVSEESVNGASEYGLVDSIQDGTILHCFDWKYNDIKDELPNIAAAGFSSVQTSPAQRDDSYAQWYMLYQPQSFSISTNALGSKEDLQNLCTEAEKYGIKVIVDVVANHTRAIGDAGMGSDCWHYVDGDIDYGDGINRYDVTHKRIGMPDLNSEHSTVQNTVKGYIEELKGVGVDGIRWDAAKHIGLPSEDCNFWPVVTEPGLYNYGEILMGPMNGKGNNDTLMKEYTNYISVTDDEYGDGVLNTINGGGVPSSIGNYSERGISKDKLVYWAESHDTYSNNGEYGKATQWIDQNKVDRAYALLAAQGKASCLYFSRPFQTEKASIKAGDKGSTHFTSKEVAEVNHLHNACVGQDEYYVQNGSAAAVCRETGAVIVKGSGSGDVSITNGGGTTAPGTYVDRVSGSTWTVTSTTISGSVGDSGIAVIYTDTNPTPSVTASKTSGATFTTDTLDVTFTVSNATSATYSIDGGAATSFSNSVDLELGANTAFGSTVSVTITATNAEGTTTKTFTYTKKEAGKLTKNTVYFTKPSGYSTAKIYAYVPGDSVTKLTGEWPGTAMTDEGDGVYSYTFEDSVSSCKVIFTDGSSQTPANVEGQTCGYDYASGKAYTYSEAEGWVAVTVNDVTPTPKPTNTPVPTSTPVPTEAPDGIKITSSLADNSSFAKETETIKITLENASKGTYSVDDGPEKEFTGSADVVIGKGKIADSTVTVKVTAEADGATATKTFTYTKQFVATNNQTTVNAGADVEEVVEEVEVNGVAETGGMYATNPNGCVGKKATITIDGDFSDWSEDMLIAQGGAWDIANNWKGGHENCVLDDYALYAAWDSENLYIAWQMVNTTDTWAREGDGPLSDGGRVLDVPLMLALNVGNRHAMTGRMANGKLIWDALDIQFDTRVDNILLMSGKVGLGTPGYFIATDENGGASYDAEYCLNFKTEGISYKMAEGCLPDTIMGLVGSTSPDDAYDASKYQEITGHNTTYDSFYEINIPLSTLGIDEAYITEHGIGVMQIATRGTSGIDCLPHDPSMLDNALGECAVDPSTSHEKDDTDIITVPLANVGKLGDIPVATPRPTSTPAPTTEPTAVPTTAPTTAPTQVPGSEMSVNFGADRSAPQYNTTALEIKAIVNGGTAPFNYEFFVDDVSVKNGTENTYTWQNGVVGERTIKVVVTDSTGKTATVSKKYDLEQKGGTPAATATPIPTGGATATATPVPTQGGETPSSSLRLTKLNVSCITADGSYKIGDTYIMRAECEGALGTPQYMFTYILNGEEVIVKNYGLETEARFVATEPGKYSFKVYVVDNSNDASPEFETGEIIVLDVPDLTITPTPTTAPNVTNKPTTAPIRPGVTETPVVSVVPTTTPVVTKNPAAPTNPAQPNKGSVVTVGKVTYKVTGTGSNKTVEYTGYKGTESSVSIPSTVKISGITFKVTSIANRAFKGNKKLKVVKIPSNVTKIGKEAFSGCTNLTTVKSGTNVASIGDKAFYNCKKLSKITLSKKLTTIGKSAFYKCIKLKKITLNSKVNKIGSKAFYGCKNLKSITIKTKKLTSKKVGSSAFKGINSKAKIKVPSSKMKAYKKLLKSKGAGSKVSYKKG